MELLAVVARTCLSPSDPSVSSTEPACHDGEKGGARNHRQRLSPRLLAGFGPQTPPECRIEGETEHAS